MTGNRLTVFGGMTLEYDDAGQLTRRLAGSVDQHLYWNALGQLDSVTNNTAPTVRYEYDGLGRRVKKFAAGGDRQWIYDGDNLLYETSGDGLGLLAGYTTRLTASRSSPRSRHNTTSVFCLALQRCGPVEFSLVWAISASILRTPSSYLIRCPSKSGAL